METTAESLTLAWLDATCENTSFQALMLASGAVGAGVAASQVGGWKGGIVGALGVFLGLVAIQRTGRYAVCLRDSYVARRNAAMVAQATGGTSTPMNTGTATDTKRIN